MDDQILRYRSVLAYNREVFLIEHAELVKEFSVVDSSFSELCEILSRMRDADTKSYVSLIPFVLLLQRQTRAAFEAFAAYQAYQAWVLLRPGVEALLIAGKFLDDRDNVSIWKNRKEDQKARQRYQQTYSGRSLKSTSLPGSDRIQRVLSNINHDFVHANPDYFYRHSKAQAGNPGCVNLVVDYFDEGVFHEAHVLAFLHFLLVMQDALAASLARLFNVPVGLKSSSDSFVRHFGARMRNICSQSQEGRAVLEQLGSVVIEV